MPPTAAASAAAARTRAAAEPQASPALRRAVERLPAPLVAQALARLARSPLAVTPVMVSLAAVSLRQDLPRIAAWLPAGTATGSATTSTAPAAATSATPPAALAGRSVTSAAAESLPAEPAEPTAGRGSTAVPPSAQGATAGTQRNVTPVVPLIGLPGRSAVDLAVGDPRQAAAQALRLAGVVPAATTTAGMTAHEPVAALVHRLVLLARSALAVPEASRAPVTTPAAEASSASTASTAANPRETPGAAALPLPALHQRTAESAERAIAADPQAAAAAPSGDPAPATLALHDAVAQDLLPPRELTDYDRVIALPLAVAGDPVPARLAVSVRRNANGGTTCWMRVDCELSRLGPVSVRLGGTDGGPVVITLIANAATGARLAEALPALAADLREQGVDAALRVATEAPDEVPS